MKQNKIRPKIIAAGHICLDISPVFSDNTPDAITDIFKPGALLSVENAQLSTGGSVANTGLAMKFFGADVRLMGKIGEDDFGTIISRIVQSHGIHEEMIISRESRSSYSIVLAPPGHDRMFLHYSGANDTFCFDDIDTSTLYGTSLFHFGYPTQMKRMYEAGGYELSRIFSAVSAAGPVTSLDLASLDPVSEAGRADWRGILSAVLPHVDFFLPSYEELLFMLDRPKYEQLLRAESGSANGRVPSVQDDIRPLAHCTLDMGAQCVMIKCGEAGIYLKSAGDISSIEKKLGFELRNWAGRELFEKSFKPRRIASASGAGDTAIAAFLVSMLSGESLDNSLQYAAATGACCVSEYDALSGLVSFETMRNKIDEGWPKLD